MRTAIIKAIHNFADTNENVFLINGDLGYGVLDTFAEKHPKKFLNAGIAEQNMIGIAAGLASLGNKVFVYSIANFPIFRCLEQIRNDLCYHNFDVNIIAVGAGLVYGSHGYTHYGIEDITVTRSLPNIQIFSPADPIEAEYVIQFMIQEPGPKYIRLGKSGEPKLQSKDLVFATQKGSPILNKSYGHDFAIFATGSILIEGIQALKNLAEIGINGSIYSFPVVLSIQQTHLYETINAYPAIFTLEEHSIKGGFGSIISEFISENFSNKIFKRIGIDSLKDSVAGDHTFLKSYYGLSYDKIYFQIKSILE